MTNNLSLSYEDLKTRLDEALKEINELKSQVERHEKKNPRGAGRKGKMTQEDKKKIIELREAGVSYNKIARELNLPVGSVYNYSKLNMNAFHACKDIDESIANISATLEEPEINAVDEKNQTDVSKLIDKFIYRNIFSSIRNTPR